MTQVEKMWKCIEEEKQNGRSAFALRTGELRALHEKAVTKRAEALVDAFEYGFAKGLRYQKAQEKKKRKAGKA